MIKDVVIKDMIKEIPKRGWYLKLYWNFDGDRGTDETCGPIPEDRKDMLVEILNLLENMIESEDTSERDRFKDIPNYKKYFDFEFDGVEPETEDYRIIYDLGLCTESDEYTYEIARLEDFDVYWHDGKVINKYNVDLIRD